MQCTRCSNELHQDARFCERCGTLVLGAMMTGHLMTHQNQPWTYADNAPAVVEDPPHWQAPPPAAADTPPSEARPAVDAPIVWGDDQGARSARTARTVGALTLVALLAVGGTVAWAVTTPRSAGPLPSNDPFTTTPSTSVPPDQGGTGSGSSTVAPGTTSVAGASVSVAPQAASTADAADVTALLQRHFAAINTKDFEAWRTTVTSQRSSKQSASQWLDGYRTTQDDNIVLRSLSPDGSGSTIATVTFTSHQDPSDAPDRTSRQLCWTQYLPIVRLGLLRSDRAPAQGQLVLLVLLSDGRRPVARRPSRYRPARTTGGDDHG